MNLVIHWALDRVRSWKITFVCVPWRRESPTTLGINLGKFVAYQLVRGWRGTIWPVHRLCTWSELCRTQSCCTNRSTMHSLQSIFDLFCCYLSNPGRIHLRTRSCPLIELAPDRMSTQIATRWLVLKIFIPCAGAAQLCQRASVLSLSGMQRAAHTWRWRAKMWTLSCWVVKRGIVSVGLWHTIDVRTPCSYGFITALLYLSLSMVPVISGVLLRCLGLFGSQSLLVHRPSFAHQFSSHTLP